MEGNDHYWYAGRKEQTFDFISGCDDDIAIIIRTNVTSKQHTLLIHGANSVLNRKPCRDGAVATHLTCNQKIPSSILGCGSSFVLLRDTVLFLVPVVCR
jgi:hypothetical protein